MVMAVEERIRATSWLGTEGERRRERGLCLPPSRPPVAMPRFRVPAGTPCRVSKLTPLAWRDHVTRQELAFERFERYDAGAKVYEFRSQGWLIRVHRSRVIHREDLYRAG